MEAAKQEYLAVLGTDEQRFARIEVERLRKEILKAEEEMLEEIPMKRFGDAAEIAAVAAFLASPAASYVNGVSIQVDGGRIGSI